MQIKGKYAALVFALVLASVAVFYHYPEQVFKRPQSVHQWRQSDCASLSLNYYEGGMNFFQPRVHNLTSDGGTSGCCAPSELPLAYYLTAGIYHLAGPQEFILRLIHLMIWLTGIFFLFRLCRLWLQHELWAACIALLMFSSPVLVYYGNNFLTNVPALSFSFIAWFFFSRYYLQGSRGDLYRSLAFFLLAGAMKISALMSPLALAATGIALRLFNRKAGEGQQEHRLFIRPFWLGLVAVFLVCGGWMAYASAYNKAHDCTYFSTTVFPVWEMDGEGIRAVLKNVRDLWWGDYFHDSAKMLFGLSVIALLAFYFRSARLLRTVILFLLAEAFVYILLQFYTFGDHDYYTIDLFILPVLVFLCAARLLKDSAPRAFAHPLTLVSLCALVAFNIYYAQGRLLSRYSPERNTLTHQQEWQQAEPLLKRAGVAADAKIISIPDRSHVSLYLLNRMGWTEYADARFNRGEPILYNRDAAGIKKSIERGATFLIVKGYEELLKRPWLKPFCRRLAAREGRLFIFDLRPGPDNFDPDALKLFQAAFCDAETLTADGTSFTGSEPNQIFQNGNTRNADFARSGKYSSKLNAASPFGLTYKISGLVAGEVIEVEAWRKCSGSAKGELIASEQVPDGFYHTEYEVAGKDSLGWEKIVKRFSVEERLAGKSIVVYLHNPQEEGVYVDDVWVRRFRPEWE